MNIVCDHKCSNLPFGLTLFNGIFKWTFLPWKKCFWDLVNHPLDIMYSHPCAKWWTVQHQCPYPPQKGHNHYIEPSWATLVEYTLVFILWHLIVERSIISKPPPWLESNSPCHCWTSNTMYGVNIRYSVNSYSRYSRILITYSGSKNCPNVCLLYKDTCITQCWHNIKIWLNYT